MVLSCDARLSGEFRAGVAHEHGCWTCQLKRNCHGHGFRFGRVRVLAVTRHRRALLVDGVNADRTAGCGSSNCLFICSVLVTSVLCLLHVWLPL